MLLLHILDMSEFSTGYKIAAMCLSCFANYIPLRDMISISFMSQTKVNFENFPLMICYSFITS